MIISETLPSQRRRHPENSSTDWPPAPPACPSRRKGGRRKTFRHGVWELLVSPHYRFRVLFPQCLTQELWGGTWESVTRWTRKLPRPHVQVAWGPGERERRKMMRTLPCKPPDFWLGTEQSSSQCRWTLSTLSRGGKSLTDYSFWLGSVWTVYNLLCQKLN